VDVEGRHSRRWFDRTKWIPKPELENKVDSRLLMGRRERWRNIMCLQDAR
jgi:hypothetical protein